MEQINKEQNNVIVQIDEILNKMSNQVKFLIRNKKLMNQLDIDLLMENTRKLYDALCSVKCNMDVDSIPMEVNEEVVNEECFAEDEDEEGVEEIEGIEGEFEDEDEEGVEELEGVEGEFEDEDEEEFEEELEGIEGEFEDEDEEGVEELEGVEGEFEDEDEEEFEEELEGIEDEFEEEDEDFEDEEDFDNDSDNEDEVEDDMDDEEVEEIQNPIPSPSPIPSPTLDTEDSGIRAYKKVYTVESHTLGDKLESVEDRSLAARLQRKPVTDLMNAIGINDKFLLLNELFGGSMEKYNKSIRALNSFSTLLGAKTYMSELQIEFQWDCESEAYKKLDGLVERRFM